MHKPSPKSWRKGRDMRKPWECPDNCPNRKPGCQNPNTCEIYAARMKRSMEMKRGAEVRPFKSNFRNRSVITASGRAR